MSRWFRHYAGMMRDEKLVSVAVKSKQPVERVVWVWGAILESAAEINDAGRYEFDAAEAAYFLRTDETDIVAIEDALANAGRVAGGVVVKWGDRQYQSDSSASRQAAYRERKKDKASDGHDKQGDGEITSRDGGVTPQDTDTDTDTELTKTTATRKAREARGTRIPDDFVPDESCEKLARELNFTTREWAEALANFLDYWRAVPGAKGRKLDWNMTFRNRLRDMPRGKKTNDQHRQGPTSITRSISNVSAAIDAQLAAARAAEGG